MYLGSTVQTEDCGLEMKKCARAGWNNGENYQVCCMIEKDTQDTMKLISFGVPLREKLEVLIKHEISERVSHAKCCVSQ